MLDGIFHRYVRLCDSLPERIEVDTDQVDRAYSVFLKLAHMVGNIPPCQEGSVDLRVKGLYASVADLRESSHVADAGHRDTCLFQHLHRSAGGKYLPS